MKDKTVRKFSRELPEDIINSCPEFKGYEKGVAKKAGATGNAGAVSDAGSGKLANIFRLAAIPAVVALLVIAGAIAGMVISKKIGKPKDPENIAVNHTPDQTAEFATGDQATEQVTVPTTDLLSTVDPTPTHVPTGGSDPTATFVLTDTPAPTATQEPTTAPSPMFEAPAGAKSYGSSRCYNEGIAALTEKSFSGYAAMRNDYNSKKDEYGPKFGEMLDLFETGAIKPMKPMADVDYYSGFYISTNGLFNLPCIRYTGLHSDSIRGSYYVNITYLKLTGSAQLESSEDIDEVIAALDPSIPLIQSEDRPLPEGYKSVSHENLELKDGTVRAVVHHMDDGRIYYRFILKGCILSVYQYEQNMAIDSEFWKIFTIEECIADMTDIDGIIYEEVQRSTDPSKLGKDEAIMLIRDAVNIVRGDKGAFQWYAGGTKYDGFSGSFSIDNYENGIGYYRMVIDGYDADGIISLINKTFTADVAAEFRRDYQKLFEKNMIVRNGMPYYFYPRGEQTLGYYSLSFTESELAGLTLGAVDKSTKTVTAGVQMYFNGQYTDRSNRNVTIYFTFKWEGGQWKISEIDAADAAFCEYASRFMAKEMNVDNVRRVIAAVLSDLYVYTRISGTQLFESSMLCNPDMQVPEITYRGPRVFNIVTGTLTYPSYWQEYASRFMTQELVQWMFCGKGRGLEIANGHVYSIDSGDLADEDFNRYRFENLKLEIIESDAKHAIVRLYDYHFNYRRSRLSGETISEDQYDLDFEFTLEDGVWKLSGGNFMERLDAVYLIPEIEPYASDSDPEDIPPVPDKSLLSVEREGLFLWSWNGAYWATTYSEVHLKPGESIMIPVLWRISKTIDSDLYTINAEFGDTEAVEFQMLSPEEAPDCELCFVAKALKPGSVTVHIYGTYDTEKIENPPKVSKQEEGVVIDIEMTIVVEG